MQYIRLFIHLLKSYRSRLYINPHHPAGMAYYQPENPFEDGIHTAPPDYQTRAPPREKFDREETLRPHRWDVRAWPRRAWALLVAVLVIIIVIVVVVVVVVTKKNKYPAYAPLKYTLADTCECFSSFYSASINGP